MYDSNGDGCIDFLEFMVVLYVMSDGTPEANLKQLFRIFDINNDGCISKKELMRWIRINQEKLHRKKICSPPFCFRIVKDLFHLLSSDDNPDMTTGKDLAKIAFKEMDVNSDGMVIKRFTLSWFKWMNKWITINWGFRWLKRNSYALVWPMKRSAPCLLSGSSTSSSLRVQPLQSKAR